MKRLTRAASVQAGAKSRFLSVLIGALALLPGLAVLAQVPSIIVPPASQTSAVGGTIQFTVSATGGGTLVYQWRKNTTNLSNGTFSGRATVSGATATAMTLAGVTTNDQANYACFISNTSGSITSSVASLAIILAPTITTQPISISTNIGAAVSFSVVASGTAPFTYQWYKDSSPISGATLNAYSLSGLLASDSGTYNVRVSNPAGSATSTNAVLNVGTAPAITSQPASLTVTQGQSATFSVTATGTSLSYYWKKNGTFIPGQTNAALTFASVADTDASSYTCQVSNFLNKVTSAGAVLTVYYPPYITAQPTNQTIGGGSNFTVRVTASGYPSVACQWRINATAIPGATGTSYSVTDAQPGNAGNYDVVITNLMGSATSSVAIITVVYYPPTISQHPTGGNVAVGSGFILAASATGTAPISWQWIKDGIAITNAATVTTNLTGVATFAFTNYSAQLADAGNYQVVLNSSSGSATSSVAVVNAGYAPEVVQPPLSVISSVGGTANFDCLVAGTAPISLQWTHNGIRLTDAINATLVITNVQTPDLGYYALTATNLFGGTVSSNADLQPLQVLTASSGVGSSVNLKLTGFPNYINVLQTTTNLTPPIQWQSVLTATADSNGVSQFADTNTSDPQKFYRSCFLMSAPSGMVLIPAGSFTMGDALDGQSAATPTVTVNVSAFYMDANLVTWSQWQGVYVYATNHGYGFVNGGSGKAANHPVQTVDWYDCVKWCNARSQQAGKVPVYYTDAGLTKVYTNLEVTVYVNWGAQGYRLPTEAEWEKAARGGLSGQRFPWGNLISQTNANYSGATGSYSYDLGPNGFNSIGLVGGFPYTSPVGSFVPNGYGLYDMAGNVWQWCWDWYGTPYAGGTDPRGVAAGSYRVGRGGGWYFIASYCRAAVRYDFGYPDYWFNFIGFRSALPTGQ